MRIYDPRLGRFLSVDPLAKKFAFYTPYRFAGNTPIQAIDLDGAEAGLVWALETYMKWKFGDPTGIKTLKSGVETNIAIESRAASYHNNKVSEKDQQKLDATFGRQADQQVLAGSVQLMKFNIETSFEVTSTFVPIKKQRQ